MRTGDFPQTMSAADRRSDLALLPENYRAWYGAVARSIPEERLFTDPLRTFAWGTDASCYRLTPKIVVKVLDIGEIRTICEAANQFGVAMTFRAAGTSLSGQAVSDSVLVVLAGGFRKYRILDSGRRIALEPGILGAQANRLLAPMGRRIGPDPASIDSCMIGGIAANNASGMCCGTAENSYRTVETMKVVLVDGAVLDTADPGSRAAFAASHGALAGELASIRDEIRLDPGLAGRIARKFSIKNTTGYGVNAFIDYEDPVDILAHLMVGSEGTLGFIAEITYRSVEEHPHKASALMVFPDMATACQATVILKKGPVSAVELMDRASLRSVEDKEGLPAYLKTLEGQATALLVETRAVDAPALAMKVDALTAMVAGLPMVIPVSFTDRKAGYETLWKIRKGLFPAVGSMRRIGTTVVIEDVVFPIEHLARATTGLRSLMTLHGYSEGIIFGHALDGNLHFVFTQDFGDVAEVSRYSAFMDAVCDMVVHTYDGSLKGEHGTGRNMAPFVELEWGSRIYALMLRIKAAFDPKGLLNPGVVISSDPKAHLRDLKPLPRAHELLDRCIECGFCEATCPSKDLTLSPRQRIAVTREMARLSGSGTEDGRCGRITRDYAYFGEKTCATDGLCAGACPVGIDTGKHTKEIRHARRGPLALATAKALGRNFAAVGSGMRAGLLAMDAARSVLGPAALGAFGVAARRLSGNHLPLWNRSLPRRSAAIKAGPGHTGTIRASSLKVVYFPSCIARSMGPAPGDSDQRSLHEAMLSLLSKAGYEAIFPPGMAALCCGMAFGSKGFFEVAERKRLELEAALLLASEGGKYPVLFDTSPCLHTLKEKADPRLALYEPVEFIRTFLLERLSIDRSPEPIAIHITCSSRKMGLEAAFLEVADALAEKVIVPAGIGCCGVAGDRIFFHPELSSSALGTLKEQLPGDCRSGYSNSRTCEIGLSLSGGIPYQSIVYLADRQSAGRDGKSCRR
ncbi:MAG: FAD-binding and (Fe-S)-binding domain-containing protein [Spirochaetota bacterium]